MLTAFVPHFVRKQYSIAIADTDTTPVNTNTATFSAMVAGSPRPDRVLIAAVHFYDGQSDASFSVSCTIGGVSAPTAVAAFSNAGSSTSWSSVHVATVPTGATVDVVVTVTSYSGTINEWGCSLIRVVGVDSLSELDDDFAIRAAVVDTTGARFSVAVCSEVNDDLSTVTPSSSSGGSTLVTGHRASRGMAFIDTSPPGGSVTYSIVGNAENYPNVAAAVCFG